ncbi:MAG: hypothetical protein ACRC9H_06000 [Aeromonas veronii]
MKVTMNVTLENHAVQYIANRAESGDTTDEAINRVFGAHTWLLKELVPDLKPATWALLWKAWQMTDEGFTSCNISGRESVHAQVIRRLWPDGEEMTKADKSALQALAGLSNPEEYAIIELLVMYEWHGGMPDNPSLDAISLCKSML